MALHKSQFLRSPIPAGLKKSACLQMLLGAAVVSIPGCLGFAINRNAPRFGLRRQRSQKRPPSARGRQSCKGFTAANNAVEPQRASTFQACVLSARISAAAVAACAISKRGPAWRFGRSRRPCPALHAVPAGKAAASSWSWRRVLQLIVGGAIGLIALLYVTAGCEVLMEAASGLMVGRSSPMAAAVIGLGVGMLHTIAGPDHLAALAPLVMGKRRTILAAFGLGALWGSGHATGQLLIGMACLCVKFGILQTSWAGHFGQAIVATQPVLVGASLILIGSYGLVQSSTFDEDGMRDGHEVEAAKNGRFGLATYATGVVHGLALDALIFMTPALALPRFAAFCHVVGVALGTLCSMGVYTAFLSRLATRVPRFQVVSGGASVVAILLGLCLLAAACGMTVPLPGLSA